jgi:uncharacterized membrane protein
MLMHLLMTEEKSALKGLLGAFHPGLVHFPIALLTVAALAEVFQILRRRREPWSGTPDLSYLAAAAAVAAAFFGFMLEDYEGASGPTVDLHKWLGIASTVVALVAAGCAVKCTTSFGSLVGLRLSLILGAGLVGATGYLGGELVFSEGHITKHVRKLLGMTEKPENKQLPLQKPVEPASDKVSFARDIAPIIKDMCFKCHGGEKVKGKFKLNTKELAFSEAASGKAILPGKSTISKFYTSLVADPESDEYMPPPKEKARPTKEQIEIVKKWIDQGAEWPDGFEFKK